VDEGTLEIFGVEANPDTVATDDDEFDRAGLGARADRVEKVVFEMVDGEGRDDVCGC
jgi:hypothetical protein